MRVKYTHFLKKNWKTLSLTILFQLEAGNSGKKVSKTYDNSTGSEREKWS